MKAPLAPYAAVLAAALSACAHGGTPADGEVAALRQQVLALRQDRDQDRRRLEALEAQLAAMARRQESQRTAPAPAQPSSLPAAVQAPPDLAVVRLAPPPRRAAPVEEEDSFVFIVDRGDGTRGATGGPSGVDAAPPVPTLVELQEPPELLVAAAEARSPDEYDAGIAALEEGDLATAAAQLQRFLDRRPRDGRADNALLALGDVFRRQQLPGKALQTWERVATEYPAGDAVPDALLRYGELCRNLGRVAAARAAFERLLADHPGSEAAARAGAYLAQGF